jgi:hypothetical protein
MDHSKETCSTHESNLPQGVFRGLELFAFLLHSAGRGNYITLMKYLICIQQTKQFV